MTLPASWPPGQSPWRPTGPDRSRAPPGSSRDLRSCAPLTASLHRGPEARSSTLALFLLAGARPDSTAGWFVLARQLSLLGRDLAHLHQLRGEVDRARELETGFAGQLRQLHEELESQSARPPADPRLTAAIEPRAQTTASARPGAPDAQQETAAARRVTDAAQDRRRPAEIIPNYRVSRGCANRGRSSGLARLAGGGVCRMQAGSWWPS